MGQRKREKARETESERVLREKRETVDFKKIQQLPPYFLLLLIVGRCYPSHGWNINRVFSPLFQPKAKKRNSRGSLDRHYERLIATNSQLLLDIDPRWTRKVPERARYHATWQLNCARHDSCFLLFPARLSAGNVLLRFILGIIEARDTPVTITTSSNPLETSSNQLNYTQYPRRV